MVIDMNVAQYIAWFLSEKNIEYIFGFAGSAMLKILEEIRAAGKVKYIQSFHEQAAGFAADAFARVSGGPGAVLVTSGPGAVNALAGICNAFFDSIPVLFFTGNDYSHNLLPSRYITRQVGFQDLDIVSMARPVTKYASLVTDAQNIAYELEKAWWYANEGRKGPVLLDIPIDVQFEEINLTTLSHFPVPDVTVLPHKSSILKISRLLNEALRPIVLVGGGVHLAGAEDCLGKFIEKTELPVVATLNGLDTYPGAYGFSGLYGHTYANLSLYNADVILALGTRLSQRQVGKHPHEWTKGRIIHVDIDPNELGRIFPEEIAICADLGEVLSELRDNVTDDKSRIVPWLTLLANWKKTLFTRDEVNDMGIDPVRFLKELTPSLDRRAIFTADVGQHQMWVAQGIQLNGEQRLLNSGGYGSMGYALPAAIGASFACPDTPVIGFCGDGGFQMTMQELELVSLRQLPVKCVIFNNGTLGMMREVQKRYYHGHYHGSNPQEFSCVDLSLLAAAYKITYFYIDKLEDTAMIATQLNSLKPGIFEVKISLDSKCINRYDENKFLKDYDI